MTFSGVGKCPNVSHHRTIGDIISSRYGKVMWNKSPKRDINPNPCFLSVKSPNFLQISHLQVAHRRCKSHWCHWHSAVHSTRGDATHTTQRWGLWGWFGGGWWWNVGVYIHWIEQVWWILINCCNTDLKWFKQDFRGLRVFDMNFNGFWWGWLFSAMEAPSKWLWTRVLCLWFPYRRCQGDVSPDTEPTPTLGHLPGWKNSALPMRKLVDYDSNMSMGCLISRVFLGLRYRCFVV